MQTGYLDDITIVCRRTAVGTKRYNFPRRVRKASEMVDDEVFRSITSKPSNSTSLRQKATGEGLTDPQEDPSQSAVIRSVHRQYSYLSHPLDGHRPEILHRRDAEQSAVGANPTDVSVPDGKFCAK